MRTFTIFSLPLLIFIFVASFSPSTAASDNTTADSVIQCLLKANVSDIGSAIFTPSSPSFTPVLHEYIRNLRYETPSTRKPLFILTASHVSQIQAAVRCARQYGLEMKIRSGGHDYEGISYWSVMPFFILDMFKFNSVEVDPATATAWVQTGATLGEVYFNAANKTNNKYGFPAGVCPTVGVGGHFGGGGYGNMMRKYGLSVDNIIDATMVDVKGRILNRKTMGEDLFWAITGAGGQSFGVVLSYRINLVPVPETVTVFSVQRTLEENAADIVYKWQYVAPFIDENLFIRMTLGSRTVSKKVTGNAKFIALYLGNAASLLDIMSEKFPELGLNQTDCIETTWVDSVLFWTDFARGTPATALLSRKPQVLRHLKRKSDYMKTQLSRDAIDKLFQTLISVKPVSLTFNPYGGKMAEIPASAKPFPHRAGNLWKLQYASNWDEEGDEISQFYLNLTDTLHTFMTPYVSSNPREAFFNYRDLDIGINYNNDDNSFEQATSYGIPYFKDNFKRLVKIKSRVDPCNFFRNEQSIPVLPRSKKHGGRC